MLKIKNEEFASLIQEVIDHDRLVLVIYCDTTWAIQNVDEVRQAHSRTMTMFCFNPADAERTDGLEQMLFGLIRAKLDAGRVTPANGG